MKRPSSSAIVGALVADAAALGLHWLYDQERIAHIEAKEGLAFLTPDAGYYAQSKGYFAHGGKRAGDSSSYGETCLLALQHLAAHGTFDRIAYQTEYRARFGPGGAYVGYIDTPTRETLRTLLPLDPAQFPAASGADDDQHPALAALVPLAATHDGPLEALLEHVELLVRITNNNEVAAAAARYACAALFHVLGGAPIEQALSRPLPLAGPALAPLLEEALALPALDGAAAAQRFGMACHVTDGLPVIVHIAQHAPGYRQAVEANIRAGGDSCGRSVMLGALAAAHAAARGHDEVIPLAWLARYRGLVMAADALAAF